MRGRTRGQDAVLEHVFDDLSDAFKDNGVEASMDFSQSPEHNAIDAVFEALSGSPETASRAEQISQELGGLYTVGEIVTALNCWISIGVVKQEGITYTIAGP